MARKRKKLLIIDGYNVLRSGSRYKHILFPDYTVDPYNTAREKLMNDVNAYVGNDMDAVIIYDAGEAGHESETVDRIGHVKIVFTPDGQSADRVIERLSHDAKEQNIETLVVTSDASIQDAVFGGGVDRMSAEGFCREVAAHCDSEPYDRAPEVVHKRTVSSRISPDTADALIRLRDELSKG